MFVFWNNVLNFPRFAKRIYKDVAGIGRINLNKGREEIFPQLCFIQNFCSQQTSPILNQEPTTISSLEPTQEHNVLSDELLAITKGDKELEHKLKVIMLETEVLRQDGRSVPPNEFISPKMWGNLLDYSSRSARIKYLEFLFKTSKKKENKIAKKLEKRKLHEEKKANDGAPKKLSIEEHAMTYGLTYNNLFLRFVDTKINHFYNSKLIQAIQFGQKLVIDCGYDQHMTKRENINTAKQLMLLFSANRLNPDPFDIYLSNIEKGNDLENALSKFFPTLYDRDFPLNVSENSYLDMFPKQKLVYLTPHCRDEMVDFDHDAIYIIGGIVDKVNNEPLSLAKAKREGITMKKFPLDRYLSWGAGSGKSLTLNQCVAILLDMKDKNDWNHALRHVPRRKLAETVVKVNNFKHDKPFFEQKKNMWKPRTEKKSRINVRNIYDE